MPSPTKKTKTTKRARTRLAVALGALGRIADALDAQLELSRHIHEVGQAMMARAVVAQERVATKTGAYIDDAVARDDAPPRPPRAPTSPDSVWLLLPLKTLERYATDARVPGPLLTILSDALAEYTRLMRNESNVTPITPNATRSH